MFWPSSHGRTCWTTRERTIRVGRRPTPTFQCHGQQRVLLVSRGGSPHSSRTTIQLLPTEGTAPPWVRARGTLGQTVATSSK